MQNNWRHFSKRSYLLRFASRPQYWVIRQHIARVHFYLNKKLFKLRALGNEEGNVFFDSLKVFKSTWSQLLVAIVIAILAQASNDSLSNLYQTLGWNLPVDDGVYAALLGGVASIGAVFIGLYYACISGIGIASYAQSPINIRELFLRDRLGNWYMRFLAFLTFFSLCMLGLRVLNYKQVPIVTPFIVVLSGVGILGFIRLGKRAFFLMDPDAISDQTFIELQGAVKQVCFGGFRWRDRSFQNSARSIAIHDLRVIESLNGLCKDEARVKKGSPLSLLCRLVGFLEMYTSSKGSIPSDSAWYERREEHPSWYASRDWDVRLAHETGRMLKPTEAVNQRWIEDRLEPLLIDAVTNYVSADHFDEAIEALKLIRKYLGRLASNGEVSIAISRLKELGKGVISAIRAANATTGGFSKIVGITDLIAAIPIDLCINYGSSCNGLGQTAIQLSREDISDRRGSKIYNTKMPLKILERLEGLRSLIDFEKRAEGVIVSPAWYTRELISNIAADVHASNVRALSETVLQTYVTWLELAAPLPWLHAAILNRNREYFRKLQVYSENLEAAWTNLTSARRGAGLRWANLDFPALAVTQRAAENQLLTHIMHAIRKLANASRPSYIPDYFGQLLHSIGEQLFNALMDGDLDTVETLFPSYFEGCHEMSKKLRDEYDQKGHLLQSIQVASGSLLDLVELSGYATLFAALHSKNQLWIKIKTIWDEYLDQNCTPKKIKTLATNLGVASSPLSLPTRGILRISWGQRVSQRLREIPAQEVRDEENLFRTFTIVNHPEALVRICAQQRHTPSDGKDIFVELYLAERVDASDVNFLKRRDLKNQIAREKMDYERYAQNAN